jgi:DNA-binding transcriptional regulator of glucitol operon
MACSQTIIINIKEVMSIMKNDTIVITQERMAGWLMFNRFHKVDEKPDLKDSNRKIFIFKDSPRLRETMEKYNQFKDVVGF